MQFLINCISPEMIMILLISFICFLSTTWDIYAILVGSFPNVGLNSRYKHIALPSNIVYLLGKIGSIINTPIICKLRHIYRVVFFSFFSGTQVSDPYFQCTNNFQPTVDFLSNSLLLLGTI